VVAKSCTKRMVFHPNNGMFTIGFNWIQDFATVHRICSKNCSYGCLWYIYILTILWVVYILFRKPIYFVHRKPYLTKNHKVYRYIYHNSNIFRYIYHKAYLTKKVTNQPGDFFTIHFWLPLQSPCIARPRRSLRTTEGKTW
jgi:hypothetical protein